MGVVGHDFSDHYTKLLSSRGVDVEGLKVDPTGKTFAWGGRYADDPNVRTTLFTDLNVLATFQPEVPEAYQDSKVVCLANLDPGIQLSVLDQVLPSAFSVCDTMNYWITNTSAALQRVLSRVDCLVINDEEARQLTGEHNLVAAAKAIRAQGPGILVVKKGEHGALLFADDSTFIVPAFPTAQVEDPTGAGDAFIGGFCGHLAQAKRIDPAAIRRAVIAGTVTASFVVEALGLTRLLELESADIAERRAAFERMTAWPA